MAYLFLFGILLAFSIHGQQIVHSPEETKQQKDKLLEQIEQLNTAKKQYFEQVFVPGVHKTLQYLLDWSELTGDQQRELIATHPELNECSEKLKEYDQSRKALSVQLDHINRLRNTESHAYLSLPFPGTSQGPLAHIPQTPIKYRTDSVLKWRNQYRSSKETQEIHFAIFDQIVEKKIQKKWNELHPIMQQSLLLTDAILKTEWEKVFAASHGRAEAVVYYLQDKKNLDDLRKQAGLPSADESLTIDVTVTAQDVQSFLIIYQRALRQESQCYGQYMGAANYLAHVQAGVDWNWLDTEQKKVLSNDPKNRALKLYRELLEGSEKDVQCTYMGYFYAQKTLKEQLPRNQEVCPFPTIPLVDNKIPNIRFVTAELVKSMKAIAQLESERKALEVAEYEKQLEALQERKKSLESVRQWLDTFAQSNVTTVQGYTH